MKEIELPSDVSPDSEEKAGKFPFTRGIHPTMYTARTWTMRQYAGLGDAAESNRRYRFLLEKGQTGLSVAFDLPTQLGLDSDDPLAAGEVGKVGVAIDTLADVEALFDSIPLDRVTVSMTINAPAAILLAMLVAVGEKQGVPRGKIGGTTQNDILKEYIARGTWIFPPEPSLRLATDVFEWCAKELPRWNTISISGYHIREAGSTAVQEVAFTLADAVAYCDAAVARGLAFDDFAPRLSFFFNCHIRFFEETAKFRAARRMWAKIARDRYGSTNAKSQMMRFHTQTAGSSLQAQQIDVNVVRTAYEAMAAVLGGTQSLHTNSKDEALGLPTQEAALLALRTQQVLAAETGVADWVDPLGGSWLVERLTDEIERGAEAYLARIEKMGGMLRAIETGYVQREIGEAAYRHQKSVESKETTIVGVNAHRAETPPPPVSRVDPALEPAQVARLVAVRGRRDGAAVASRLDALERAARAGDNLLPSILEAVRVYASVGEVATRLRRVFGTYAGEV